MPAAGICVSVMAAKADIDDAVAASRELAALLEAAVLEAARPYTETKCHSCGASDWKPHDGKEVCAYCRSDRV